VNNEVKIINPGPYPVAVIKIRDKEALVDANDLPNINCVNSYGLFPYKDGFTARSDKKSGQKFLHLQIIEVPKGHKVVWKNGNTLDCRRANLATIPRNQEYVPPAPEELPPSIRIDQTKEGVPQSGVKGVTWHKASSRWAATAFKGGRHCLGYHKTVPEAVTAIEAFKNNYKN
jgi:hypothetical protein